MLVVEAIGLRQVFAEWCLWTGNEVLEIDKCVSRKGN